MVEKLVEGIQTFQQTVVPAKSERFAQLATGQAPATLFITCADSRIDPSLITQTEPGDLFVIRNAGNIAPAPDPDGSSADGTAASIEFAAAALKVQHIVVCGHSSCGAMAGLADLASVAALPSVARWLEHSHGLVADGVPESLDALIEQNVLLQLENLARYPSVKALLDAGAVTLHGWVYDIGSGDVRAFDGEGFVSVTAHA